MELKGKCELALEEHNKQTDFLEKVKLNDEYSYNLLVARASIKDQIELYKKLFVIKKIDFKTYMDSIDNLNQT